MKPSKILMSPKICCICKMEYTGYGNNAWPVDDGQCCDICQETEVLPARILRFYILRMIGEEKI
jgi:hypothetical protein